jgi:hypothetical protein
MGSGADVKERIVRGCRAIEKDDGGAEEVGSWLRREVLGESGRELKAVVWVLVRARCWIDWTDEL